MAEQDTFVAVSDGDQLNEGYFNQIYYGERIQQIYTSTGFDVSQNTNGSDTASYELDAITATNLAGANYVEITMHVYSNQNLTRDGSNTATATNQLKVEAKEIGGSYSETMANQTIIYSAPNTSQGFTSIIAPTVRWVHELTSGEKSSGVQFKITATAVAGIGGSSAVTTELSNKQTVVKTMH